MSTLPFHPIERKVLAALREHEGTDFDGLVAASGLGADQVRRALTWLSSKGMVEVRESSTSRLSRTAEEIPELLLLKELRRRSGPVPLEELRRALGSNQPFSAAIGRATSAGWVSVEQGGGRPTVELRPAASGAEKLERLASLTAHDVDEEGVPREYRELVPDLVKRGLLSRSSAKKVTVALTEKGRTGATGVVSEDYAERLTPDAISSGRWKGLHLRPIDVEAPSGHFHPGRRHPVREFIDEVREAYLSMGFTEITGNVVQTAFWNFDALFTPQDHPARELQDTFYLKGASDPSVERKGLVDRVASTHENGWKTGSKGWGYRWKVEEARRLVLRTHNTALTIQATAGSGNEERRVFSVGRVYRNESLDATHLAEHYQMEGIVIGDDLNMRHLKGVLSKFYSKLGMSGVRLWPSFFPYTEPSMQVMTYSERLGKWLEMGGSGIFRPEVTLPLGVTKPVIAWGCGLERLLMLRLGLTDVRELYNNDLGWLRKRPENASSQDTAR